MVVDFVTMVGEGASLPRQVTRAVGKLLGKKSGGDRAIGLIAMLCRARPAASETQMKGRSSAQTHRARWGGWWPGVLNLCCQLASLRPAPVHWGRQTLMFRSINDG